jgi:hypothetical protein
MAAIDAERFLGEHHEVGAAARPGSAQEPARA